MDAGAYTLKVSQIILGQDLTVAAANLHGGEDDTVEIWGGAYLQQKNGPLFSQIAFGFDQQYQCSLELWGSKGRLTANRLFTAPPDYPIELIIESGMEREVISVEPANHFKNMLQHFHGLTEDSQGRDLEYVQNNNQARLIREVFAKALDQV